jgi:twitching motility protein PilT
MAKTIQHYLEHMRSAGASDLHFSAGRPPLMRVSGHVAPIKGEQMLHDDALRQILRQAVSDLQWNRFERDHDLDFAMALPGIARFRGNYFEQQHGCGAVFRVVPDKIVPLDKLGAPDVVRSLANLDSGLVLVTGPTGSGKSTTLAGIIDLINDTHARHIVTIEDPVEFVHENKRSILSHREVGSDTEDFEGALRAALRQDAEVILVGELRDLETISLAIDAASMGVLVFGTLHTNSAVKTVDRILEMFPADRRDQARSTLADALAAVVSQILVPRKGGGRVAVHEILLRTTGLSGAIREGNTSMIASVIAGGKNVGMQTMDGTLMACVEQGLIEGREAYLKASDKKMFQKWQSA